MTRQRRYRKTICSVCGDRHYVGQRLCVERQIELIMGRRGVPIPPRSFFFDQRPAPDGGR